MSKYRWSAVHRLVVRPSDVGPLVWAATLIVALLPLSAAQAQELASVNAPANACANLKDLRLPDVRFIEIADDPDSLANSDNVRVPHCRVRGMTGKEILFTVMLPSRWNQRLVMGGNGGYAGTLNTGILTQANNGYVAVTTNTGHEQSPGGGARWALNDPERQLDYGYVAVHRTVEIAKVLAKAFYGSEPRFAYFTGCSNGGRQGLMEVQRYPDDFDGVISGAPAAHMTRTMVSFMKNIQAAFPTPAHFDKPIVTKANLDLLAASVLESCDAADGIKDGVLDDPRDCRFKLALLRPCVGDKPASDCLTRAQRAVLQRVYSPTTDERGREIYPGQPFGGENLDGGWWDWILGRDSGLMNDVKAPSAQAMFAIEGAKYFLFSDPDWDYSKYRGSLLQDARRFAPIGDADNPDIRQFGKKGKLILWHGWNDPALNPLATIEYYEKVIETDARAREYVRLFMAPGVLHCGDGNGPAPTAILRVLVDWVERGRAPEQLMATRTDSVTRVVRRRPLCAYPKRAVYTGTGSTDDANNFVCRER